MYADGRPVAEIAQRLGRTPDAVVHRRKHLGVASRRDAWTPAQDAVIVAGARSGLSATAIAEHLGLPPGLVRQRRARLLGTRPAAPRYTTADDALIRDTWGHDDVELLAAQLGRTPDALRLRAAHLGLHHPHRRLRWSEAEDAAVRAGYRDGRSCEEIARTLGHTRTHTAVAARARKLGLTTYARQWTGAEDEALRIGATSGLSGEELATALFRTEEAVRRRARTLGVTLRAAPAPARQTGPWTTEDDAVLLDTWASGPAAASRCLGRSESAVRHRAQRLGLQAPAPRSPHGLVIEHGTWTPAESALVARELTGSGRSLLSVARRLGRTPGAVQRHANTLRTRRADAA